LLCVGKIGTLKLSFGTGWTSNVVFVVVASKLAFVGIAGAFILANVCLGLPSNGVSFVGIAKVVSLHEVLLMTMVLSSSSSSSSRLL